MPKELSPIKQKILLLLLTGITLGLSHSSLANLKIIKGLPRAWKKINEKELKKNIKFLYQSKLISLKENSDGNFSMVLTDKGRVKTLNYRFTEMKINHRSWDKRWRLVIFDIPERIRKGRDALRDKLKNLGFYELQKSVFIFPYECKDEIDFLIEFFNLRKYVRYGVLESIDNELHLKSNFNLT